MEWFEKYYPDNIAEIIPEGERGNFQVKKFQMTEQDIKVARLREMIHPNRNDAEAHYLKQRTYIKLVDRSKTFNDTVMSDTPMEMISNLKVLENAKGNVLIAGLGLGMILLPIAKKAGVERITVVEKSHDVIELIAPHLAPHMTSPDMVQIICKDIFEFNTKDLFDTIYFDIWNGWGGDQWEEMKKLKRKFRKNLKPEGWMGCWKEQESRYRR